MPSETTGPPAARLPVTGHLTPAQLTSAAENLLASVREAATEQDAILAVFNNWPMAVILRAGDLLRIPDVDFHNKPGLSAEIARLVKAAEIQEA